MTNPRCEELDEFASLDLACDKLDDLLADTQNLPNSEARELASELEQVRDDLDASTEATKPNEELGDLGTAYEGC